MQMMQDAEHFVISTHVSLRKRTDSYCLEYCAREFQLTSPQGDELAGGLCKIIQWYFNSRLRKETNVSDRFPLFPLFGISTHVSARRRTLRPVHPWDRMNISIHVFARERTSSFKYSLNTLSVLQLTSPQGDEQRVCDPSLLWQYFNSRLRKETNQYSL